MAFAFGIGTWVWKGKKSATEYFTAFLVEKSLSIDNLFVFLMLFDYFKIPFKSQNRVLTWGLLGAVVMRGIMIFVGVSAIQKFKWITLVFAGILLASAYKLMCEEEHSEVKENAVMRFSKMIMATTDELDGEKFYTVKEGKKLATPLLTCLVCIELSDFVFAVDSIPAVLGVSHDPFIVYSSNIFAILGMRSLYILISQAVAELKYIRPSVAAVLGFVGAKMVAEYFHVEVSSFHSLLVIISILTTGLVASILARDREAAAAVKK
ncbi:integral membrane protein TerC family-domain-containing protein [Ochromonadaceae sp. CCMP2298]|nr:integral membrane protein TerC family-domain-containing protein [Ochromonadaceae sp. CCMP2298]